MQQKDLFKLKMEKVSNYFKSQKKKMVLIIVILVFASMAIAGFSKNGYFDKNFNAGVEEISLDEMNFNGGLNKFNNKEYKDALIGLNLVKEDSPRYEEAQKLIAEANIFVADEYLQDAKEYYNSGELKNAYDSIYKASEYNLTSQEISDLKNKYEAEYKAEKERIATELALATKESAERNQAEEAKRLAEEKAYKKSQGVSLGMTQQDVLDSSWGRPSDVNRTTSVYGTDEQWCYGNGNYLYFEDGILTSIQN